MLGWTMTSFAPCPRQVAIRENYKWTITNEDPNASKVTVDQIISVLDSKGMTSDEWLAACAENDIEIKEERFQDLRAEAAKSKRAKISKKDNKWYPTAQEMEGRAL